MEPEILDFIPKGKAVSLERKLVPQCIKQKARIYGYIVNKKFYDIGTVKGYRVFDNFIKGGQKL
jgi:NDP-sugar pyrophosphorylase family protein